MRAKLLCLLLNGVVCVPAGERWKKKMRRRKWPPRLGDENYKLLQGIGNWNWTLKGEKKVFQRILFVMENTFKALSTARHRFLTFDFLSFLFSTFQTNLSCPTSTHLAIKQKSAKNSLQTLGSVLIHVCRSISPPKKTVPLSAQRHCAKVTFVLVFVTVLLRPADLQMSRLSSSDSWALSPREKNARVCRDLVRPRLRQSSAERPHFSEAAAQKGPGTMKVSARTWD